MNGTPYPNKKNELICNTQESKIKNIKNKNTKIMCNKKLHTQKNKQNIPHYVFESQITKERYEITKFGFYTQSTYSFKHVHTGIDS